MAQQTAIGYTPPSTRREKNSRDVESFFALAQKQFARTMAVGIPGQAVMVLLTVCILGFSRLPGGL